MCDCAKHEVNTHSSLPGVRHATVAPQGFLCRLGTFRSFRCGLLDHKEHAEANAKSSMYHELHVLKIVLIEFSTLDVGHLVFPVGSRD